MALRRPVQVVEYASEEEMCSHITQQAKSLGFVVYPEVRDWDLVLSRHHVQIGVQVKQRFNPHIITQALAGAPLGSRYATHGPHYRVVACQLTKNNREDVQVVCRACRLLLLDLSYPPVGWLHRWRGRWIRRVDWRYYRWYPGAALWLPPAVPDIPAGVRSPKAVGPWQIASVRVEQLHDQLGYLTNALVRELLTSLKVSYAPSAFLRHRYTCVRERDKSGQRKWIRNKMFQSAVDQYPEAADVVLRAKERGTDRHNLAPARPHGLHGGDFNPASPRRGSLSPERPGGLG